MRTIMEYTFIMESIGEGPLIVMIHGFPDFWYTWRNQMAALAQHFQVVAIDLRGYNLSDKPQGGENYLMDHLVGDVQAVIRHIGRDKAIIIGHDWGGAIAWQFAILLPALTERLIILNMPHPRGIRTAMRSMSFQCSLIFPSLKEFLIQCNQPYQSLSLITFLCCILKA